MAEPIKNHFQLVVQKIFNNWTALQLAVEHNMGGDDSKEIAIEVMDWVCNYCLNQTDVQVEEVTEALEDILDEEFSTICEDNSPGEVAQLLVKFLQNLRQGNLEKFQADFNALPTCNIWLSKKEDVAPKQIPKSSQKVEETEKSEQKMDVDSEWTVVQTRRRK